MVKFLTNTLLVAIFLFCAALPSSAAPNPTLINLSVNTALDLGSYVCVTQPGDQPCNGITGYSKFIYDKNNYQILMFGGGHAETFRDDVDVFNFNSLTWNPAYAPTPCAEMTLSNLDTVNGIWRTTGYPVSRHTYDMLVMTDNEMVVLVGETGRGGCAEAGVGSDPYFFSPKINHYNPITKTWRQSRATVSNWYYAAAAEYDPISKKVIVMGQTSAGGGAGFWVYDPIAETLTPNLMSNMVHDLSYAKNLVYFPPNQKMYYMMNNGSVFEIALDRSNLSNSTVSPVAGISGALPSVGETGFAYDSVNQIIGGAVKNNIFLPPTPLLPLFRRAFLRRQYLPPRSIFPGRPARTTWG